MGSHFRRFVRLSSALRGAVVALLACAGARAAVVDVLYVDGFEAGCGNLIYAEPFALSDNSAWPAPWTVLGNVQTADVQQQMARLQPNPTTYSLARMGADIVSSNVEIRFTLRFEDIATQGVGYYARQNGGYLMNTTPHGQGYAVFVQGFGFGIPQGLGLWKEIDGTESLIAQVAPPSTLVNGVDYRVHFQVQQQDATHTQLRAKLWLASDAEPAWQISATDLAGVLQNLSGGIAIDSWSNYQSPTPISAHTFVDNVELISLCAP